LTKNIIETLKFSLSCHLARFLNPRIYKDRKALKLEIRQDQKNIENLKEQNIEIQDKLINSCLRELIGALRIFHCKDVEMKRFGTLGDGGYILLNDLRSTDFLISGGIGDNIDFEMEVADQISKVVAIDHTVPNLKSNHKNLRINHMKLSSESEIGSITLTDLLKQNQASDYLLKLDIEGDEWSIFDNLTKTEIKKFRQIVVEFHWLHGDNSLQYFEKIRNTFNKLNYSHAVLAVSANNWGSIRQIAGISVPDVIEVTYVRKSNYRLSQNNEILYSHLQFPNNKDLPPIENDWLFQ
jgi:hypothetical protein